MKRSDTARTLKTWVKEINMMQVKEHIENNKNLFTFDRLSYPQTLEFPLRNTYIGVC